MKLLFDTNGNDKQKDVARLWIDNSVSDIVYGGSKGSGKSYLGCSLIFGDALTYPGTHYFIVRKELTNIRKFTIPSIYEVLNHWNIDSRYYTYNGQDNFFRLYNDSKVYLFDAKQTPTDPEFQRFGSMQMTRGWIEEAGEIAEAAKNNLSASVGRWKNDDFGINGKILQTCNPSKNYLYREYYRKHKNNSLEDHKRFIQALPEDNKKLSSGYLDHLNKVLNKSQKDRLLKGNWEYADDPTALCDYDEILEMFKNDHIKEGDNYLTADIARLGSDKAIIAVWSGWIVIEFHVFEISRMTDIQNAINALRSKHQIPKHRAIADEDGIGGGVVDNCGILGFVNNSRPVKEAVSQQNASGQTNPLTYYNLQSQCGYKLAEKINASGIWIKAELQSAHKDELIEDLEQLKSFDSDKDAKVRILPKAKIKDAIGRSPDWRDVLLMRMSFDLNPGYGQYDFI